MSNRWARVTKDSIYPDTQFRVTDLLEGCEYEFRVSAENEIGVGDPSPPSKPVFARDPVGMMPKYILSSFHYLYYFRSIIYIRFVITSLFFFPCS